MASFVLTALSVTIGLFFILVGTIKLTPLISEELYREMRKEFIRNAKVFPLALINKAWAINPHIYRKTVGIIEVTCGTVLFLVPGPLKLVANLILLVTMLGATWTHYMLGQQMDKMTPSIVFSLLLICRLIIYAQVTSRESKDTTTAAKSETEKKRD